VEIVPRRATAAAVLVALLAVGAFEQISQVILVREFFVVFKGNEVSFGTVFAFWMLWTAAGSWVAGIFARRIKKPARWFCILNILLCVLLTAEIYLARISRSFFDIPSGAYVSIFSMALFTFVMLAGVCFVGGALFVIGAKLYAAVRDSSGADVPARAYIADSLGCLAGGVAATFVLVIFFDSFTSAFISAVALLAAATWLAFSNGLRLLRVIVPAIGVVCLILCFFGSWLNWTAEVAQWQRYNEAYELVDTRNSKYGNLAVLKYAEQYSLFGNGDLYFSMPDEETPKNAANLFMLQHPAPKEVLVVGGGISGMLRWILHYDVGHLDYVELDPAVIDMARKYLVSEDLKALNHETVHIHNTDGRMFIWRTQRRYDLVICQLPDPSTASLNRFYTLEFFERARQVLKEGGVFITGVSGEGFWEKELMQRNGSVFATLATAFPKVFASPDGTLLAGKEDAPLSLDAEELTQRYKSRGLDIPGFVPEIFYIMLEPDSVEAVNDKLQAFAARAQEDSTIINTDSFPVSYFYNLLIWNRYSESEWVAAFDWMITVRTWWVFPALGILLLPLLLLVILPPTRARGTHSRYAVLLLMSVTGLFGMVIEITLLYWFQNVYGYVYAMVGLLTSMFMFGLAVGAIVARRAVSSWQPRNVTLFWGTAALGFCAIVGLLGPGTLRISPSFSVWVFLVLNFAAGLIVGAMFRMMAVAAATLGWKPETSAGMLYGADLMGACLGSLAAGSLLIPVLGTQTTCLVVGLLMGGALGGFALAMRKS
jgi:spermidine synthase